MKKLALALVLAVLAAMTGMTALALLVGGAGISAAATCPTGPLPVLTAPLDEANALAKTEADPLVADKSAGRKDSAAGALADEPQGTKAKARKDRKNRVERERRDKRPARTNAAAEGGRDRASSPDGAWDGEQLANAVVIVGTGRALAGELDLTGPALARAQALAVMTAIGESSLRNLDHGDAVGPDSRGLFQQRANGVWGTYADRMTPATAAAMFYRALIAVPGWADMAPTLAAHTVQRNADPYHYAPHWNPAVRLVSTQAADPALAALLPATGTTGCALAPVTNLPGALAGAASRLPAQGCTQPDPTRRDGCLTPRTAALAAWLLTNAASPDGTRRWSVSCWDAHAWNPTSDHPDGKACDVFPGPAGRLPTGGQQATGDALATILQANADRLGVHYVIWSGRIWSTDRPGQGWRPYTGGGIYDPADITGGHHDHLHISMR